MALFYGWGSTASRLQPFRGGSLLFPTEFPEIPGTLSLMLVFCFDRKKYFLWLFLRYIYTNINIFYQLA